MRLIFGLVLFFGITLAGSAVFLVQKYMTAQKVAFQNAIQERGHAVPTIPIFVMKRPVRFGEELRPSDVAIINWPKAANPSGSFVDGEILFPQNGAQRFVVRAMERGEPVLAVKITQPGENAGIRSTLTKGMRAFAINVNVQTGVSGFLRPGDRVDVYWTGSAPTTNGRRGR
ncbi:MAG: Flp pilus assembly protein CpaB, partial [Planktomarina sp.]